MGDHEQAYGLYTEKIPNKIKQEKDVSISE